MLCWGLSPFLPCILDILGQKILLRISVWYHHSQRPRDLEKLMLCVHGQNHLPSGDGRKLSVTCWARCTILKNSLSCGSSSKLSVTSYGTVSSTCAGFSSFFSFLFSTFYFSISSGFTCNTFYHTLSPLIALADLKLPVLQGEMNWVGMMQNMWCRYPLYHGRTAQAIQ